MIRRVAAIFAMVMIAISFCLKVLTFWMYTYGYEVLTPGVISDESFYPLAELAHLMDGASLLLGLLVFLGAYVFSHEERPDATGF